MPELQINQYICLKLVIFTILSGEVEIERHIYNIKFYHGSAGE
jgi:hypothetical protein